MDKITHEVRLAQWAEVVKQCQSRPSGMSANTWLMILVTSGQDS